MKGTASEKDNELATVDTGIQVAVGFIDVAKAVFDLVKRIAIFLYGVGCYLIFLATFAYMVGFVGDLPLPKTIDTGMTGPFFQALLADLALVALFGLQHSLMARTTFKRIWTRIVPVAAERSTFVLAASAALLLVAWLWQPMPQVLWSVRDQARIIILYTVFGVGWILVVVSTFLINHFDFSGLAQAYAYLRGEAYRPPAFKTPFLYQYVRHPMMTGLLIGLWATPRMTVGHLLFAVSMTTYILIGVSLEERSLLRTFGKAYEDYRSRTSRFLPLPWRMRRAGGSTTHMSETTRSRLLRVLLNCWPALRGAGMRVTYVAPGIREIHVNLSLTLRTFNALGTIFGGSIYAACDPWFSIMLLRQLGPGYIVWDKAASIQFKKPGRGRLSGCFAIDPAEAGEIARLLETERSVDRVYHADLVDSDGAVVASVEKVVYVRRGDRKQQTSNSILRLVHHMVMRV